MNKTVLLDPVNHISRLITAAVIAMVAETSMRPIRSAKIFVAVAVVISLVSQIQHPSETFYSGPGISSQSNPHLKLTNAHLTTSRP